jgi:hypothetical protein
VGKRDWGWTGLASVVSKCGTLLVLNRVLTRRSISQLIVSSIKSVLWTSPANGVIAEGSLKSDITVGHDFIVGEKGYNLPALSSYMTQQFMAIEGIFINALHEAWRHTNASLAVANLISAFINVQVSSVLSFL